MKKFILCADGFGRTKDHNRAILNGYNNGFIKSCSIDANGAAFDAAINDILPECPNISVGANLNITYGSPITRTFKLTDANNNFKYNCSQLSKLSKNNPQLLNEIENELRAQLQKIYDCTQIYHITSNDFVHLIPEIFDIVCRLAHEYKIPYVRLPYEEFYYVPDIKYIINCKFLKNIPRIIKYNYLSKKYKQSLKKYNLISNDYIIGVCYKDLTDTKTLEYGLKTIADEDGIIVECPIEACSYLRNNNDSKARAFKMSQDKILEDSISRLGYEITNHRNISK